LIRIGTRASALAEWIAARVGRKTELVRITTAGDRGADVEAV
jgi:porphobilinogen deaminase